jgi:hypothetical protein
MFLQERMDLLPDLIAEQPSNLALMEPACPVRFNGDRLERPSRHVLSLALQRGGDVLGKVDSDLHNAVAILRPRATFHGASRR